MIMRRFVVFALTLSLALLLTWAVAAQGSGDVEPPDEGGPYFPETHSGKTVQEEETEEPTPPQPERGQRPLPPSVSDLSTMGVEETLSVGPLGMGAGPFDQSYFYDDIESGSGNWTATGLWHIADASSHYPNAYDGDASWWYGQEAIGNYDTGVANTGAIETGPISIPADAAATWLRFWSWEYTESSSDYDMRKVYTSTNGSDWSEIWQSTTSNDRAQWYQVLLDLSDYRGEDVYLRFEFDTVDSSYNGYRGWYVDEVAVGYDQIQLFPSGQTGYDLPGDTVYYPWNPPNYMWMQNNTGVTTLFTLTATGTWTPTFPATLGPVDPGQLWNFDGNVQIPANASLGTYDDATLLVTSQATPTLTHTQTVRTWAGWLHRVDHQIIDDGSGSSWGDGDGRIDPGETIEITLTLKNDLDRTVHQTYARLYPTLLTQYDTYELYGDIAAGATANSFGRYEFGVPATITPGMVITFDLHTYAREGRWDEIFTETVATSLELLPDSAKTTLPGGTVTYTLALINRTGFDDSFDLSALGNTWPTNITPDPTGIVSNGTPLPITVTVDVPAGASMGDADVVTIQAAGLGPASTFSDAATLTTTASCFVEGTSLTTQDNLSDTYEVSPRWIYVYVYSSDDDTLDATVWGYNDTTASWEELASQTDGGSGVLMDNPIPAIYSRVRVWLDDTEDNDDIYYNYRFDICPPVPEVILIPDAQQGLAWPGKVVTYTQRVFNVTEITTAINLEIVDNAWPTTLLSGTTSITQTDVLSHGADFDFSVRVEVPDGTNATDTDTPTIRATSAASPTLSDTARLTTTLISQGWYQAYVEDYPTTPWADDEAYLDSVNSFAEWQLTDDRDDQYDVAVSAFYRDRIPYAWTHGRDNAYDLWVNEVEFGARNVTGTVVIPATRVADHNYVTDNAYDYDAAIAVDPVNGNIGLAWTREDRASDIDPWRYNVYYAVYDEDGDVVQPPTALTSNINDTLEDYNIAIEAYRDGHFAVAWERYVYTSGINSVCYAVMTRDGNVVKSPTELIPDAVAFEDFDPRLAQMLDGNMMVLWEGEFLSTSDSEAAYAILDTYGNVVQEKTALTDYAAVPTGDPDAAGLDAVNLKSGELVVAWTNDTTGQIEYTILDESYTVVVPSTVLVNTLSSNNWNVSLTEDEDGRAIFTWYDEASIYYALVDPSGSVVIEPVVYREARNNWLYINWKGYGNGGMEARPQAQVKVYLPLVMRNH